VNRLLSVPRLAESLLVSISSLLVAYKAKVPNSFVTMSSPRSHSEESEDRHTDPYFDAEDDDGDDGDYHEDEDEDEDEEDEGDDDDDVAHELFQDLFDEGENDDEFHGTWPFFPSERDLTDLNPGKTLKRETLSLSSAWEITMRARAAKLHRESTPRGRTPKDEL
jgi:hypothetical protein